MFKSFVLVICIILFSVVNNAQSRFSIGFGGGIISPINSQNGLIGQVNFLYSHSDNFNFYTNIGYSYWDVNHIGDEEDHILVPVYFGGRYYFNRNKPIEAFLEAELGINFLQYSKYDLIILKVPDKNEYIISKNYTSKTVNKKMALGFGIGLGFIHLLTEGVNLNLGIKVNVLKNNNNYLNTLVDNILVIKTLSAGFICDI